MSDEHIEKLRKTLANFGDFLEEKIGEFLVEHKAVWNTLADGGEFLAEHKKIIVVVVGTSILCGLFFDGWEIFLWMIVGSSILAIFEGFRSRSLKEFYKRWGFCYCVSLGLWILGILGIVPGF